VTQGAVLLLCRVSQRSESVCVDHWEIAEAPTSDHVDALRRKDESEDIFNELNGRQERICAPCSSSAARTRNTNTYSRRGPHALAKQRILHVLGRIRAELAGEF
jgi:hypothetical protein